jgi:hypothetical protein
MREAYRERRDAVERASKATRRAPYLRDTAAHYVTDDRMRKSC